MTSQTSIPGEGSRGSLVGREWIWGFRPNNKEIEERKDSDRELHRASTEKT
jgi:hypothetical protein